MTEASQSLEGDMEFSNSPVDFAIVGPLRDHRGVYARSGGSTLDLIGLDTLPHLSEPSHQTISTLLSRVRGPESYGCQVIVVSSQVVGRGQGEARDTRRSHISFAWRGFATPRDLREIERIFEGVAPYLYDYLRSNDRAEIELMLAPVIARCHAATKSVISRRLYFRNMVIILFAAYLILLAIFIPVFVNDYISGLDLRKQIFGGGTSSGAGSSGKF